MLKINVPETLEHVHDVHPAVTLISTNMYMIPTARRKQGATEPPNKRHKPNVPIVSRGGIASTRLTLTATNNANNSVHLGFNPTTTEALVLAPTPSVRQDEDLGSSTVGLTRSNGTTESNRLETLIPLDVEATDAGSNPPGTPGPAGHSNTSHPITELGDQQGVSRAAQDSRSASGDSSDGCGVGTVLEGAGQNFIHRHEHGGRATAVPHPPILCGPHGSTSQTQADSPPLPTTSAHGFQTNPDVTHQAQTQANPQPFPGPMTPVDNEGSRADENTADCVLNVAERYQDGPMHLAQEGGDIQLEMAGPTLVDFQPAQSVQVHGRDGWGKGTVITRASILLYCSSTSRAYDIPNITIRRHTRHRRGFWRSARNRIGWGSALGE
jgi:hypothetical protein